jgi:hypothetical protein
MLLVLATGVPRATAQSVPGAPGWTFEPATADGTATSRTFFDYSLAPGEAIQDYVRLTNPSDHDLTFAVYGADAYTTTQGAFALRLRDQPRTGVGGWVSLPFATRTVAAETSITFPFQLGIPADIEPGDWAGGVVAVATDPATPQPASNVTIEQGVGARIYLRVRGPLHPGLTVTKLDMRADGGTWAPFSGKQHAAFTYEIANTGNVRLTGTARLDIVDAFGRTVKSFSSRTLPELLPHDRATVTEAWDGAPLLSTGFRPRLVVDADGVSATREAPRVWRGSFPAAIALVLAVVLAMLIARSLVRRLSKLRHRPKALVPA